MTFHFSTLKAFYPKRIKVLSLLLNIIGAKITLYELGTKLTMVVSVEINESIHCCITTWWEASKQNQHLNKKIHDVDALKLEDHLDLVRR
jgi:hypothetical protein